MHIYLLDEKLWFVKKYFWMELNHIKFYFWVVHYTFFVHLSAEIRLLPYFRRCKESFIEDCAAFNKFIIECTYVVSVCNVTDLMIDHVHDWLILICLLLCKLDRWLTLPLNCYAWQKWVQNTGANLFNTLSIN